MYNLKPFNNVLVKASAWFGRHPLFMVVFIVGSFALLAAIFRSGNIFFILPFVLLFMLLFYAQSQYYDIGSVFARKNHLEKFFIKHGDNYGYIYQEYHSMLHSTFLKKEKFVWSLSVSGTEFATVFTDDGGCLCWMPLDRAFPHVVIDSLADNPLFGHGRQWAKHTLPSEAVSLEGNFNHHFKVYQEQGEQITTLQILTPDRMAVLLDRFEAANVEIQDTYLRIYVAGVQKSSKDFQAFLDVLAEFSQGFKVERINKIR